jgi:hypothetical protein
MNSRLIITDQPNQSHRHILTTINQKEGGKISTLKNNPDITLVKPDKSITINQTRQIKQLLSKKPFAMKNQYIVIKQAHLMTVPAQNSLLKSLEELAENQYVFLLSSQPKKLLPTIISRCQIVRIKSNQPPLTSQTTQEFKKLWQDLTTASPGKRLQLIEPYQKTREQAMQFCRQMTVYLRSIIIKKIMTGKKTPIPTLSAIKNLQITINQLQQNCNVKLCLDVWVLAV